MRLRSCLLPAALAALGASLASSCTIYDTSLLLDAPAAGGSAGAGGDGQAGEGQGGEGQGGEAGEGQGGEAGAGGEAGSGGEGGSSGQGGGGSGGATCTDAASCDDQNECTTDACEGTCTHKPDDTKKPTAIAANCKAEVCKEGKPASVPDDNDKPTDDGEPCTVEGCEQGAPKITNAPDDSACTISGKSGVCKGGKCQVECTENTECNDNNACTTDACTGNKCVFTPLADNTPTPGAADTPKDCKTNVCSGGKPTETADAADLPDVPGCQTPLCTGTTPGKENKPDGDACNYDGGALCIAGACKPVTCGDKIRSASEECEGSDLGGKTCADFGFGAGSTGLVCGAGCKLDATGCKGLCGNGVQEAGEECDDNVSKGAPGDGCSKFCRLEPKPGDLVITEIMYNPQAAPTSGSIELGEWFEVYNASTKAYDVRGLQLTSKTAGELHIIGDQLPSPLVIQPGAYVVFARGVDETETTGFTPFYSYGSKLSFGNSSSDFIHIEIATTPATLVDGVDYNPSATYTGKSYSLQKTKISAALNDDSVNYCVPTTEFGVANPTKDRGTPGVANDCP